MKKENYISSRQVGIAFHGGVYLLFLLLICGSGASQPRIIIKEGTEFELGKIEEGLKLHKELSLFNRGDAVLKITDVITSCGCTIATPGKDIISPNDSTTLGITIDFKGISGPVKKTIKITSNDPQRKDITITMRAIVQRIIECDPSYISFHSVEFDSSTLAIVNLHNTSDSLITLSNVVVPDSGLSATLSSDTLKPNGIVELKVILHAKRRGKLLGQIEVNTSSRRQPLLQISFVGSVGERKPSVR